MKTFLFFSLLLFVLSPIAIVCNCIECDLDVPQLIEYYGYPAERHKVVTKDGYTLNMHRIPYSPKNKATPRPPVLLQHGLLDSSAAWVVNLPSESLGYLLADAGFDVWLGNNRGNYYSPPPNSSESAWGFSFDEMALYDLPAQIQYVLDTTKAKTLGYVGHSEGTTQAFAGFSFVANLSEKVNMFVALAPVAYVGHQTSALISLLADLDVDQIFLFFGAKDFLPENEWTKIIGELFCAPGEITTGICEDIIFALCGKDTEKLANLNSSRIEIYIAHTPAGTSVQNLAHWAQSVRHNTFEMYDYGSTEKNEAHYNQPTPPVYDLSKVNLPIGMYTASHDDLADPTDVLRLFSELPQSSVIYVHNEEAYDHLDFTWGVDAAQRIYPSAIQLLKNGSVHAF